MTPNEDRFAPKGEIRPVREALLRFAPAGWRLPFDSCLDSVFQSTARRFNEELAEWNSAPRPNEPSDALGRVAKAAKVLANELDTLDRYALASLLGDVMISRDLRQGKPHDDDRSVAFAPEIAADTYWRDGQHFLEPTVARLMALGRIAQQAQRFVDLRDRGGRATILSKAGVEPPKARLALDCFWVIAECFGYEIASREITTTTSSRDGHGAAFFSLVVAMFTFGAGDNYSDADAELERPIKWAVKTGKAQLEEYRNFVGRPFPLADEIARANSSNSPLCWPKPLRKAGPDVTTPK